MRTTSTADSMPQAGATRLSLDPLRVCVALLIVVSVSRVQQAVHLVGLLHPGLLLVAAIVGLMVMTRGAIAKGPIFKSYPARVMIALGVMACASVPMAISVGASGKFILSEFSKVLLGAFFVLMTVRNGRDLYTYLWAYVLSTGILAFLALFVIRMSATNSGLLRLADDFSYDANDIGSVMIVGLAIALLVYQVASKRGKIVVGGVLLMVGAALAKSGSRGAFLGLVVVGGMVLVMLKQISAAKRVGFVAAVMIALAVAAPAGYWDQMGTILSPKEDYNWTAPTGRKAVFMRGIGYMMRNPITGIGIGNFMRAEGTLSDRAQNYQVGLAGVKWSAAHNSFLQTAAEMGIPGLLLFVALIFGSTLKLRSMHRRMPNAWERGSPDQRLLFMATQYLPVAMLGFAVVGFFVSFAYYDVVYSLCAIVAATLTLSDQALAATRVVVPHEGTARGSGWRLQAATTVPVTGAQPAAPIAPRGRPGFVPHRMRR